MFYKIKSEMTDVITENYADWYCRNNIQDILLSLEDGPMKSFVLMDDSTGMTCEVDRLILSNVLPRHLHREAIKIEALYSMLNLIN